MKNYLHQSIENICISYSPNDQEKLAFSTIRHPQDEAQHIIPLRIVSCLF